MTSPGSHPTAVGAGSRAADGPLDLALVAIDGPLDGQRFALRPGRLRLGRTEGNDVVVPHATVSGSHAVLDVELSPGGLSVMVTDLGSTNGTLVDGFRLDGPGRVGPGNTVTFGAVECVLEIRVTASDEAWEEAAASTPAPARRRRTVLVAHDPADRAYADVVAGHLQRAGHLVWIDRSPAGDGWKGRLLDTVWSCDGAVFVVSPAAVASERVRREVHLAAAQRCVVLPALVGTTELPDELEYYVAARPAVDLRSDPVEGLRELAEEVGAIPRKRFARPWRTLRRLAAFAVLLALAFLAYRIVF